MTVLLFGGALIAGVCVGLLGAGGGILAVPLLIYAAGLSPHTATGASLILVGGAAAISSVTYALGGHVQWKRGAVFACLGMLGSWAGAALSPSLPERVILTSLALLMVASGIAMLGGRTRPPLQGGSPEATAEGESRFFTAAGSGVGVGLVTGALGAGGGFLIVPSLHRLLGFPVREAVGTSVVIITANCAVALTRKLSSLEALRSTPLVVAMLVALCASFAASRLSHRIRQPALKRLFAAFVLTLGAAILLKENVLSL